MTGLRRNDGRGAGMTGKVGGVRDRGAARLVRWLVASHPPPDLPPGRGRDGLGGWVCVGVAWVPACAGMTEGVQE